MCIKSVHQMLIHGRKWPMSHVKPMMEEQKGQARVSVCFHENLMLNTNRCDQGSGHKCMKREETTDFLREVPYRNRNLYMDEQSNLHSHGMGTRTGV